MMTSWGVGIGLTVSISPKPSYLGSETAENPWAHGSRSTRSRWTPGGLESLADSSTDCPQVDADGGKSFWLVFQDVRALGLHREYSA